MKFQTITPAFIMGQYVKASVQEPQTIELPDGISLDNVSSSWIPLDKAAVAALGKLGVAAKIPDAIDPAPLAPLTVDPAALTPSPVGKVVNPGA